MARGIEGFLEKLGVQKHIFNTSKQKGQANITNLVYNIKIVFDSCYIDCAEIVVKYLDEGVEKGERDERIDWKIILSDAVREEANMRFKMDGISTHHLH
jgi:hypothetical protein